MKNTQAKLSPPVNNALSSSVHVPILLEEVITCLNIQPGDTVIDGTINGGGHALRILEEIGETGMLIGIDRDGGIIKNTDALFREKGYKNYLLVTGSYADVVPITNDHAIKNTDAILLDLGFSSYHVDMSGRGFSFLRDEPLDMRYSESDTITAADILNEWAEGDIEHILTAYGEERFAKRIAHAVIKRRKEQRFSRTEDVVDVVRRNVPTWYRHRKIHFATKTFQALRIAVNDELEHVAKGLTESISILKPGGRLVVLAFHSQEDRIVKQTFRKYAKEEIITLPHKKPIMPARKEIYINPRARSAKMRVCEKI
ncbi:MAG: hypothetical protein COU90_04550 [Candidatus Ryanbacteria bacterium CG10_big_fil_rev_8_21_14_0_10_43_42]|uniref:Ribosomal RNA small subunit methyltransferase H n=1 Tax=Candidatus Ryanbacteria bacterium CG10_big_fil_rev_8_21_14_0_10_43_42 TaxID=1974864 RepID=A0A2M8KW31_9BACT|nr:MAG: hypothetical protein COU90_04550 [Candidatus Ryanbacteria bacterium CG10_big_fil_rev_8_21_14_0_10_43_42]